MVSIEKLVRERILILDGAMGTMIQRYNLTEEDFRGKRFADIPGQMKGNNDLLCLTRPDVIQDIHRKYLMAGADIIETNTFSSTSVSMADYHVQEYVREMNLAAVKLAREVADEFSTPDKPRFVAGSIGPTNKTCSMSPDVNNPAMRALTYDELADAYREQMEALLEGGVDARAPPADRSDPHLHGSQRPPRPESVVRSPRHHCKNKGPGDHPAQPYD